MQESLPVSVRRLRVDDIDQVIAIEKEAFSPLWVSSSFKRDINNRRANYLVACFDEGVSPEEILAEFDAEGVELVVLQFDGFDDDVSDAGAAAPALGAALYSYPDNGLSSVQDIKTFATLIVDERDVTGASTRGATDPAATNDFIEGSSSGNTQAYAWDDPGSTAQAAFGWAPLTKTLDGNYYIYIVADDGTNPPVFAVSGGALQVRHIPIVRSVSPVAADTTDTGEYSNLAKANPYKVKFTVDDYDDNAQMRLFMSTAGNLALSEVKITGTFPDQTLELEGATVMQLSDTLRTDEQAGLAKVDALMDGYRDVVRREFGALMPASR